MEINETFVKSLLKVKSSNKICSKFAKNQSIESKFQTKMYSSQFPKLMLMWKCNIFTYILFHHSITFFFIMSFHRMIQTLPFVISIREHWGDMLWGTDFAILTCIPDDISTFVLMLGMFALSMSTQGKNILSQ